MASGGDPLASPPQAVVDSWKWDLVSSSYDRHILRLTCHFPKGHRIRLQMAAYQALQVYQHCNLSRTHCLVVDMIHTPDRRRGSSPFVLGGVTLTVLLELRAGLPESERRRFDRHLQWMWEVPLEGLVSRTLTIVRFWSGPGFIENVLIAPGHFSSKFWPVMSDWTRFLL